MNEDEILQRVKEDDPRVITQLYKQYHQEFTRFIRGKYPKFGMDEAEDIFSDCFQILCGNIKGGKLNAISGTIKAYLFKIGWRLAWDEYHRKDRANGGDVQVIKATIGIELPPDTDWNEEEKKTILLTQTVNGLKEPCKSLLSLFWYEGKRDMEIVELTNYQSADTVKNQRSRCMRPLRMVYLTELVNEHIITTDERKRLIGE